MTRAAVRAGRRLVEVLEEILAVLANYDGAAMPVVAILLDRDANPQLAVNTLGSLLTPPANDQENDQVPSSWLESATALLATLAESTQPESEKSQTIKSSAPSPNPCPTRRDPSAPADAGEGSLQHQ